MEGLLKFGDLEEHFSNSLLIIDLQSSILQGKQDLEVIVSKLDHEIKRLKESEQKLTQQLRTFSSSAEHQDSAYSLYVNLKEKYNELQSKYNQQEKEKIELVEKCKREKNEITEDFVQQMKLSEKRNENQKQTFLKIQSELSNELAAQQASADIRYDEMESHLELQIRDITKKLHDSVQSCNTMRQELFSFRTCSGSDIDSAKKRIQELERDLRLSRQQLQSTEEKLLNFTRNKNLNIYSNNNNIQKEMNHPQPIVVPEPDRPPANIVKNRIIVYNENPQRFTTKPSCVYRGPKYHPLNVGAVMEQEFASSEEFSEILGESVNAPTEPIRNVNTGAGSSNYNNNNKQNNHKYSLPPLKQVSVGQPKQKMNVKRRKLYNPDNLDYLLDIEPQE